MDEEEDVRTKKRVWDMLNNIESRLKEIDKELERLEYRIEQVENHAISRDQHRR
jgi:archaellum component FlaC